jgi:hypothetical protein
VNEVAGKVVGYAVGQVVVLGIAAQVLERQNDDRQTRR